MNRKNNNEYVNNGTFLYIHKRNYKCQRDDENDKSRKILQTGVYAI